MALKTNVYISEVTNLTEARYYAGMEVSMIGFNATPNSATYSSAIQFDAITSWLSGIKTVWQYHSLITSEFTTLVSETPSDFVELNYLPDIKDITSLLKPLIIRTSDLELIKKITPELKKHIEYVVWEGSISELPKLEETNVYFQTTSDLKPENFILENPNTGIALKGVPELRPGWNDFEQLADILEALETV